MRLPLAPLILAAVVFAGSASAQAVSNAPLQIINVLIEHDRTCPEALVEWNRKYNSRVIAGDAPRDFYYRVLGFLDWGSCGHLYYKRIFSELQKSWLIYQRQRVSDAEIEAKEAELINLLMRARQAGSGGEFLVQRYEDTIKNVLFNLEPERQYFNCTLFGTQPRCLD